MVGLEAEGAGVTLEETQLTAYCLTVITVKTYKPKSWVLV